MPSLPSNPVAVFRTAFPGRHRRGDPRSPGSRQAGRGCLGGCLGLLLVCLGALPVPAGIAPKPLYRDPVHDGAADPAVVWNPHVQRWWMFYTNRRAKTPGLSGVAWVHGTRIGIAESADGGVTWMHAGECDIELPEAIGGREPTHWAPEVITGPDGTHHLWLSVVPGIFENWEHPRRLVHLTSRDLRRWRNPRALPVGSDRVIDACVAPLEDGSWRLWYNDERDGKSIHFADSPDLVTWTDRGRAVGDQAGEGPKVVRWKGAYWMITDVWRGLAVYRSADAVTWVRQPGGNLLEDAGRGADDGVKGGHADVVVVGPRAYLFYFTHPGRTSVAAGLDGPEQRRSSIQVVELQERDGRLTCDRDRPTDLRLPSLGGAGDSESLVRLGRREVSVHDPSTPILLDGRWWMYATGQGLASWSSGNRRHWRREPPVFASPPGWHAEVVPGHRGHLWAPDAIRVGDRLFLYYSVSSFGKNTSAIGLATRPVAEPDAWREEGLVVRSTAADGFNAIDPAAFRDRDGRLWLVFGSFWRGIQLLELDAATGLRRPEGEGPRAVAWKEQIEAPVLHRRGDWYYLFVNWGLCCRGTESTYEVRVGRSRSVTGPYVDQSGQPMREGGGSLVLGSRGPFVGPGQVGVFEAEGSEWISVHFYDRTRMGRPALAIRALTWSDEGWPVVGEAEPGSR